MYKVGWYFFVLLKDNDGFPRSQIPGAFFVFMREN